LIFPEPIVPHIQPSQPTVEDILNRYEGRPINQDTEHRLRTELRLLEQHDQQQQRFTPTREAIKIVIHHMLGQFNR
jgi:hypothetical protein